MESAETTPTEEIAEKPDKYGTKEHWQRWISAAKKASEQHWKDAEAAWGEYEHSPDSSNPGQSQHKTASYPIYWSSVKTIEPAYYSRTPRVTTTRRFELNDDVASTAGLIAERFGQYLIENCDFDAVIQSAVGEFIHADKATTQLVYEHEVEETQARVALVQVEGGFIDQSGQPYPGEVFQDEQGFFGQDTDAKPKNQKIHLSPVSYDDVLHTPDARTAAEICDMAFKFSLPEHEAAERFLPEVVARINWKISKGEKEDRQEIPGKFVEGWEIYCRETKKVYWYSDQYPDGLLDVKDDPYKLRNFFPAPAFIIGSKPRKTLYPTPAYIHCRDVLRALHEQAFKVYELIRGIRRRALVDGSMPELASALQEAGDNEFIAVRNIQALVEKGGLQNVIQYIPVQELVDAISELSGLEEKFKQAFYEWFGVPDILRGASDPVETAAAQEVKAASANDRFKFQKKQVAQLVRDSIEMMVDLGVQVFPAPRIAEIVGVKFMTPEDQQRFPAALQLLQNDDARLIRVDIDTDSMSFLDQQLKQQRVNQAVQTVTEGLKTVADMSQGDPTFLPVGLHAVLLSLEHLEAGKQFQDGVKKAVEALIQAKENPPETPPPPDYEAMKLEIAKQKADTDAALKAKELEQKELRLALDAQKQVNDTNIAKFKADMDASVQDFAMQIEAQRLQLESFKADMQARESEMEEIRLARESDLESMKSAVELAKSQPPAEAQAPQIINVQPPSIPPITIVNEAPKPGTKTIQVMRDELGNATSYAIADGPMG